jgi:regulator of sigma E protease
VVVIAAGPAMNVLIAFLLIWGLIMFSGLGVDEPQKARVVAAIEKGSPAAGALKANDSIVSIDGRTDSLDFQSAIAAHTCAGTPAAGCRAATPATIVVNRGGERTTLKVTPVYDAALKRTRLGFSYGYPEGYNPPKVTEGPVSAAGTSVDKMWFVTHTTVSSIVKIFYNSEARKQVSGVVGSYEATRQSFAFDTAQAIWILALISLSLAVVNLFPFLPLDGGHIFWAVAEKLRGKPIAFTVMERAGFIGFALVAVLFVVGLSNDIGRIADGSNFGVK